MWKWTMIAIALVPSLLIVGATADCSSDGSGDCRFFCFDEADVGNCQFFCFNGSGGDTCDFLCFD